MKRNCNLELRLLPSSATMIEESRFEQQQQQQQQLTIFYKGKVSVCDVTELQARAIILLASRETEERRKSPTGSSSISEPSSPLSLQSQLCSPATGLSMKRSLQRFLQKRKTRIEAASPYHH